MRKLLAGILLLIAGSRLVAGSAGEAVDGGAGARPWAGRHQEIETALLEGRVVARERIGTGITNPWKLTLEHEGAQIQAVWKPLVEKPNARHPESWRAEVAAYRLNRELGLDLVPPTVARRLDEEGSLQLWVEGYRPYADRVGDASPGMRWLHQLDRMRLFDAFLDNDDRNGRNFLVDDDWNLVLIDHSRALPMKLRPLPPLSTRFDRGLVERLRALDREDLDRLLGDLFSSREIAAILRQRDRVLREVDKLIARGRGSYFDSGS